MLKSIRLSGVGPAPEMNIELAERLNLLTGDNGLGKSFVLDVAWWALSRTWWSRPARPRADSSSPRIVVDVVGKTAESRLESVYDFQDQQWSSSVGRPHMPGIVVYARVDGGFSVWDPARNYWRGSSNGDRPRAFHLDSTEVWEGLIEEASDGKRFICNGLIRDWVSWQERDAAEYHDLLSVLEVLSPPEEPLQPGPPTRVSLEDSRDHPTLRLPYGVIPLVLASAGMRRVVSLAYLLVWAWSEHRKSAELRQQRPEGRLVFLVDELEAHLHPRWQRTILPSLLTVGDRLALLEPAAVQVIGVTHSPLVVASAEPFFDADRDALFLFDLDHGRAVIRRDEWERRGDVCAWLTSDVFDLREPRSLEAENLLERARELVRQPEPRLADVVRLDSELSSAIPSIDPFWVGWVRFRERVGVEP